MVKDARQPSAALGTGGSAVLASGVAVRGMAHPVPWWTVATALGAPAVLIGGSAIIGIHQPPGYDAVTDTISTLASYGADNRWLLTGALVSVGFCYLMTALGLRPAARPGRLLLALGGISTMMVAVFPQPTVGSSALHLGVAGVGFVALTLWPAAAYQRQRHAPWVLRRVVTLAVTFVLLCILAWFGWSINGGPDPGVAERVVVSAETVWPMLVAITGYRKIVEHHHHSHEQEHGAAPEA
jgi:hypothetical membrane protein